MRAPATLFSVSRGFLFAVSRRVALVVKVEVQDEECRGQMAIFDNKARRMHEGCTKDEHTMRTSFEISSVGAC